MVTPGGLEPPAYGLGNRRSILLSYGVTRNLFAHLVRHFQIETVLFRFRMEPFEGAVPFYLQGDQPIGGSLVRYPGESSMKSTLNNACISALLCGAVIFAAPAIAQQGAAGVSGSAGATATGAVNPAASAGISGSVNAPAGAVTGGVNTQAHGGLNTDTTASMSTSTQTPAARMSSRARAAADASEAEATRQLNSQATVNARGTTGATIQ
jgi:hypothetical protein